jgi:hypothetical protein
MTQTKVRKFITIINNEEDLPIKILGLDCSSSVIGWGLLTLKENSPVLLSHGHIKPLDSKFDIVVRLQDVYEKIGDLCYDVNPTHVSIEDIILHMKGLSSAKTITTLAVFNRTVGTSVYIHTGIVPELLSVGTIRKLIRESHPTVDPKFKKEQIPDIIREHLEPGFVNIMNRNDNVSNETYDEADGIAAAWAYSIQLGRKQ